MKSYLALLFPFKDPDFKQVYCSLFWTLFGAHLPSLFSLSPPSSWLIPSGQLSFRHDAMCTTSLNPYSHHMSKLGLSCFTNGSVLNCCYTVLSPECHPSTFSWSLTLPSKYSGSTCFLKPPPNIAIFSLNVYYTVYQCPKLEKNCSLAVIYITIFESLFFSHYGKDRCL